MNVASLFHGHEWVREHLVDPIQGNKDSSLRSITDRLALKARNDFTILIVDRNGTVILIDIREIVEIHDEIFQIASGLTINNEVLVQDGLNRRFDKSSLTCSVE
jgi:hypothetical protein